jgi:integrase
MSKYCPENERVKRDYAFYMTAANGKQNATIDAALRAIERFETSTKLKPFRKFHVEQVRSFRARLSEELNAQGKPLSAATITSTLKHLRAFFLWLSREPGFRSVLNENDANHFTPSEQDVRIATATREKRVASLDEIKRVLALMPAGTAIEQRDRALVAFAILTGARDGALATFRLKHLDLSARSLFQDGRDVGTKKRKTFTSIFFPVGPEPLEIVTAYVTMLRNDLGFSDDDPLFPSTLMGRGEDRGFVAVGLSRVPWAGTEPIRRVFRAAFAAANLTYAHPHSIRKTLTRIGQRVCRTPEEWKVWSQNLGHDSETTTFVGYGEVPADRHAEVMLAFGGPRPVALPPGVDFAALKAFVQSIETSSLA